MKELNVVPDEVLPQVMLLQASEACLQRMVALYASSHYKNTPNDLILMSDAPAHHLFALLGPVDETQARQNALSPLLALAWFCFTQLACRPTPVCRPCFCHADYNE